jgi:hypothetical protein
MPNRVEPPRSSLSLIGWKERNPDHQIFPENPRLSALSRGKTLVFTAMNG